MSEKLKRKEVQKIRNNGTAEGSFRKGTRQPLSTQELLNRLFLSGVVGIIGGAAGYLLIFKVECSGGWYVLPIVLTGIGLVMLVSAWYTRQGMVHGRLIKFIIKLMNAFWR